jgi:hypothetical protein
MTSALDLLCFTARVDHRPDPSAKNAPTTRFYVGLLENGVEVVGRRRSIILVIGVNNIYLTWIKCSAHCRPTHAALYERPTGGEPFDGSPGRAVATVIDPPLIPEGNMVTLTWRIVWTG